MEQERWIDFWLVDTFTSQPLQGNPAGVILEAEGLPAEQMRLLTREVGVETAFAFPPTEQGHDLHLRWFTPTCEVPFSGHATLATLHVLVEAQRYHAPKDLTIDTLAGALQARLCPLEQDSCTLMVQTPTPTFEPAPLGREELAEAMLVSTDSLHPELPLRKEGMHLFVPLHHLDMLLNLHPDLRRLSRLGLEHEITGFAFFATETIEPESHWHLRFFAPGIGISEDPVTGVAQGSMAAYLVEQEILPATPGTTCCWIGEQGDTLERRGRVQVQLSLDDNKRITEVRIGGTAVTAMQGRIRSG